MKPHQSPGRRLLVALPSGEESASLRQILSPNCNAWTLHCAGTFPETGTALHAASFGVVICPVRFEDGHGWKDVLHEIQQLPIPPQLIIADRLADERLWAEALNFGCYDLLMTPFQAEEVLRVVGMAWGFWERELERAAPRPKPAKPANLAKQHFRRALAVGAD